MTDHLPQASSGGRSSARDDSAKAAIRWIAHRGWSTRFPENSLPAFAGAIAAGADEIEFDVRHTADGVPVLLHDPDLDRVSMLHGPVEAYPLVELQRATIVGPNGASFPGMGLATLDQVIQLFAPHVGMNVHVKALNEDATALRLIQAAAARHPEHHIYIAGDETVLEIALAVCPEVPRCCLSRQRDPTALLTQGLQYRCAGLQFKASAYTADAVTEARTHGLFANLFYADTPADARRAIDAGIDGVLTNDLGSVRPQVVNT